MPQILKMGIALVALAAFANTIAQAVAPGVYSWWGGFRRVGFIVLAGAVCFGLLTWATK